MSAFEALMLWMGLCYLVYQCRVEPLQPDRLEDDLTDVDLSDVHRQREIRNADWMDRPIVNVVLSRRFRG